MLRSGLLRAQIGKKGDGKLGAFISTVHSYLHVMPFPLTMTMTLPQSQSLPIIHVHVVLSLSVVYQQGWHAERAEHRLVYTYA
jgi:hypothetical protein